MPLSSHKCSLPIRWAACQIVLNCVVAVVVCLAACCGALETTSPSSMVGASSSADAASSSSLFEFEETVSDLSRAADILVPAGSLPLAASSMPHASSCPVLYVYYDSTCGHCRTMAPRIGAFARSSVRDPMLQYLLIGAINCASHVESCNEQNVTDVPTMFFASNARQNGGDRLPSTTATTTTRWTQLPASLSSADGISTAVQRLMSPVIDVMPPNQREICELVKQFLMRDKTRKMGRRAGPHLIAAPTSSMHDDGSDAARFVEERNFHASDVAASLFYALYHEVPLVALSTSTHRRVLSEFLEVVAQHLPGLHVEPLVQQLATGGGDGGVVAPKQWRRAVCDARIPWEGTAPDQPHWRTCRGSSWKYRGYTCGMWLLYHSLLANAPDADGLRVVGVVRAFVTTFFSCADCRTHFGQFAWVPPERHDHRWSVGLQLWAAHNQVNGRLQGVVDGQDPLVPKRTFPDAALCGRCLRHGDPMARSDAAPADAAAALEAMYDTAEVAVFLRRWFRWDPSTLPHDGSDRGAVHEDRVVVPPPTTAASDVADCDDSGDTCPLEAPHTPPNLKQQRRDRNDGSWFVRTRHPSFVVKRDPMWAHMLLTLVVVATMVGCGYTYSNRRGLGSRPAHTMRAPGRRAMSGAGGLV